MKTPSILRNGKARRIGITVIILAIVALLGAPSCLDWLLISSAGRDDAAQAAWLLHMGADPNVRHADAGEALAQAASRGNDAVVRLLLQAGANPNLTPSSQESNLIFAAEGGHLETVRLLLAAGADPNAGCEITPLKAAKGNPATIALLKKAGARE